MIRELFMNNDKWNHVHYSEDTLRVSISMHLMQSLGSNTIVINNIGVTWAHCLFCKLDSQN